MEFYSTIFNTYDMMILDSVFPLFFFFFGQKYYVTITIFFSLFILKNFKCLGKEELAGEEGVCPK